MQDKTSTRAADMEAGADPNTLTDRVQTDVCFEFGADSSLTPLAGSRAVSERPITDAQQNLQTLFG